MEANYVHVQISISIFVSLDSKSIVIVQWLLLLYNGRHNSLFTVYIHAYMTLKGLSILTYAAPIGK